MRRSRSIAKPGLNSHSLPARKQGSSAERKSRDGGNTMLKRILFFTYGIFSYLIFLGTFLYAIGFIGNFGVPRTLDGAATGSLVISFAINAALLTLFAVQHSVMARKWFKEWWTRLVPKPIERST